MRLNTVRILRDWQRHEDYGINAMLPGLELDEGDVGPGSITVHDETVDGWVARRHVSAESSGLVFPVLALFVPTDATLQGEIGGSGNGSVRDGEITVCFAYLEAGQDPAGTANALYAMRALRRSLAILQLPEHVDYRQRNGIALYDCSDMREPPVLQPWNDAVVTAALLTTWQVRDSYPLPQ